MVQPYIKNDGVGVISGNWVHLMDPDGPSYLRGNMRVSYYNLNHPFFIQQPILYHMSHLNI
jgi:hypothetical protein